jgi:hypothetical protein
MNQHSKKITVYFYKNINGKEPVRDWLLELDREDCKIIGIDIKTVEFGWPIGMPVCKPLGRGLYEVRSNLKDNIARTIFCIEEDMMILLHGFIKKSQKTPDKEIELALKRKKEVLNNE